MDATEAAAERPTLRITNIPQTITASDLLTYLESQLGAGSVFALEIVTDHRNWKPRGFGRVQFSTLELKSKAQSLPLSLKSRTFELSDTFDDIIPRPALAHHRVEDSSVVHVGFMVEDDRICELETWKDVRVWVMPERRRVEFWVGKDEDGVWKYKVEIMFEDVLESVGCCLGSEKLNALLLKFKHGPRIYERISGPDVASKFKPDRYHICREDFDFLWVRTMDFTCSKSIGQSNTFCWEIRDGLPASEIFSSFPYYKEELLDLVLDEGEDFHSSSETVPLMDCDEGPKLDYEIVYQLNVLIHTQKISLAAAYELIDTLLPLDVDTTILVLQKLHRLTLTCFNPVSLVKTQLHLLRRNQKSSQSSSHKRLSDRVMNCHRALITPSKIYCLGPELESSNYVVKHFAEYASDFLRVSFVEEDWSKLPPNTISASINNGIFAKPFRTRLYHRILTILREGIVIGGKRFQFLAFSASQLRSNSVWMFASNDNVTAEQIREWMGCFKKIRSVSKCAARMGQLFSSSFQTLSVPVQDVEIIPDVEVNKDGVDYCFSDGIGKISLAFARQVAQKCGLGDTPSAFQIRYGGYKGVIAVDRDSFRKLSLRASMRKFESENTMLNVTKWSEAMPCYLNREIISLLSTLGVEDEVFLEMQQKQLLVLAKMLTDKEAALKVLESLSGIDRRNILVKMLLIGYEPSTEPYLLMMLKAHHETQLADLRSRCRIHVPGGRILIGCLDETGLLEYGQVYVRLTLTKEEQDRGEHKFFKKIDDMTSVVLGKVVVTKNPCLHPGDIRVLEAVYKVELEEKGLMDCIVFPQKGERPHPNECSGGDLDGDLFFVSWEEDLVPTHIETPMDYTARRLRIMDHDVTPEEIYKFFINYMINDTLGAISTAHLVHADREPEKARSEKCLELANLHSMAVDFAKTGAPAEMPRSLRPREYPDFMERFDKPMYTSVGVFGKLYRATLDSKPDKSNFLWSCQVAEASYDTDLEVDGFRDFLGAADRHRETYAEKLSALMHFYGTKSEDEILTGNLRNRAMYLQRDNRKFGDMKDRMQLSVKNLHNEAKGWFENSCKPNERQKLASAWYHVTYHPSYCREDFNFLSFPWIVGDLLLNIKGENQRKS
ncbi:RNA-dependent RNA polymerase 2 [Punica granatum]|uniref:RNA-dependent RNA polymerase n=2 Tax=Punica granatum TaxID=22663 RepID=A0A218XZQ4_PUNGR|nr:RNA-dependent RNA polymerase 2 [Punica granatum]OWM90483.1 hypothetical protein CDL15_Pgr014786 [Punica granatum]PKI59152.1 hypothetical protein CRG98_020518 [Punica granatum]